MRNKWRYSKILLEAFPKKCEIATIFWLMFRTVLIMDVLILMRTASKFRKKNSHFHTTSFYDFQMSLLLSLSLFLLLSLFQQIYFMQFLTNFSEFLQFKTCFLWKSEYYMINLSYFHVGNHLYQRSMHLDQIVWNYRWIYTAVDLKQHC